MQLRENFVYVLSTRREVPVFQEFAEESRGKLNYLVRHDISRRVESEKFPSFLRRIYFIHVKYTRAKV